MHFLITQEEARAAITGSLSIAQAILIDASRVSGGRVEERAGREGRGDNRWGQRRPLAGTILALEQGLSLRASAALLGAVHQPLGSDRKGFLGNCANCANTSTEM